MGGFLDERMMVSVEMECERLIKDATRSGYIAGRLGQVDESVNMSGVLARAYHEAYLVGEKAMKAMEEWGEPKSC